VSFCKWSAAQQAGPSLPGVHQSWFSADASDLCKQWKASMHSSVPTNCYIMWPWTEEQHGWYALATGKKVKCVYFQILFKQYFSLELADIRQSPKQEHLRLNKTPILRPLFHDNLGQKVPVACKQSAHRLTEITISTPRHSIFMGSVITDAWQANITVIERLI